MPVESLELAKYGDNDMTIIVVGFGGYLWCIRHQEDIIIT
jgi:hypothetical protein